MAWEWSHTHEAYADAERNLRELPRETLEEILAEWSANAPDGYYDDQGYRGDDFDQEAYDEGLANAKQLPDDTLADTIWALASDQATCDNGGFKAWLCPYGCGCHTVPFDRQEAS